MAQVTSTRNDEISNIHRQYIDFYKISGGLVLIIIGIWIGSLMFSDGYATNVYTEILSVIATIVVLDRLNDWRETERLQKRLIREAGGQSNEAAKAAVNWLRAEKWLTNNDSIQLLQDANLIYANLKGAKLNSVNLQGAYLSSANLEGADLLSANLEGAVLNYANLKDAKLGANLQGASLKHANLQGAYLKGARLQGAKLDDANLEGAKLDDANLEGADLIFAKLQGAVLKHANLQGADLRYANLENADLSYANLQGAVLKFTNLEGVVLREATFNEKTVLPKSENQKDDEGKTLTDDKGEYIRDDEGKMLFTPESYWTAETDMSHYTDPEHPDFWHE